jgi:hypothetical protein
MAAVHDCELAARVRQYVLADESLVLKDLSFANPALMLKLRVGVWNALAPSGIGSPGTAAIYTILVFVLSELTTRCI